ncbi:MAG: OmpW family protein [Hyphomicrobiaceae bacterium]
MQKIKMLVAAAAMAAVTYTGAAPAAAGDYSGDFMVRLGGTVVAPDSSADVFAVPGGLIPGSDGEVNTVVIPSATLTYFFNKNLAAELFCCFAKLNADAKGTIAPLGEVADFWVFPPIVTLQYHFDSFRGFKPYVGAGVQWIHFFNEKSAYGNVNIDDAFGFALQAGVDVEMGGGWYLNADVKKVWIDTEVHWTTAGLRGEVDIDPWLISVNLGYRFNLFGPRYTEPLK